MDHYSFVSPQPLPGIRSNRGYYIIVQDFVDFDDWFLSLDVFLDTLMEVNDGAPRQYVLRIQYLKASWKIAGRCLSVLIVLSSDQRLVFLMERMQGIRIQEHLRQIKQRWLR